MFIMNQLSKLLGISLITVFFAFQLHRLNKKRLQNLLRMVSINLRKKEYMEAIVSFNEAIKLDPTAYQGPLLYER